MKRDSRHRVLILMKALGRGGAEQIVLNAAPHLDFERFAYEVAYLLPWRDALVGELTSAGLKVHCLAGRPGFAWPVRLRHLVTEQRYNLIHCHTPYMAVGARVAFGRRRPRLVVTEHNLWSRYHRMTYWANLLSFFRTDHAFAVSGSVRRSVTYPRLLRFLPMPPVETLLHGADLSGRRLNGAAAAVREELGIDTDAPVVGTVANLKPHKDIHTLLEAAALVRRRIPHVRFVIVGDGPLAEKLRHRSEELGLDGAVLFTGFRDDAPRLAATFDVFVLSSLAEGLPIALLEAMTLARPVVVTNVGGLPEVVEDGVNGLVVPPSSPDELSRAIAALLVDPARAGALGRAAMARASEFDIRAAVTRMEDVYERLLRPRKHDRSIAIGI